MTAGIVVHTPRMDRWLPAIAARLPEADVRPVQDHPDPGSVVAALVWRPPPDSLAAFPNLRLIQCFGHGVDALLADRTTPDVPIARLVDPELARAIARFVLHASLHHLLEVDEYRAAEAVAAWAPRRPRFASAFPMAVLGHGAVGREVGYLAAAAGFAVRTWTRTPHENDPAAFSGPGGLAGALDGAGIVVNALPLTPATASLCDTAFFERFRGPDTLFVNVGRGGTVDEPALLEALNGGRLGRAVLDVTRVEPLPKDDPLWSHPQVTITPHVSGPTEVESAADLLAANLRRVIEGREPEHLVDRIRGY